MVMIGAVVKQDKKNEPKQNHETRWGTEKQEWEGMGYRGQSFK